MIFSNKQKVKRMLSACVFGHSCVVDVCMLCFQVLLLNQELVRDHNVCENLAATWTVDKLADQHGHKLTPTNREYLAFDPVAQPSEMDQDLLSPGDSLGGRVSIANPVLSS